jgi:LCP family protein required for cell wall assembly
MRTAPAVRVTHPPLRRSLRYNSAPPAPNVRPDLEPTQRIPIQPDYANAPPTLPPAPGAEDEAPPSLPQRKPVAQAFGVLVGLLVRIVIVLVLVGGGLVAAALLLTPPRESILVLGSDARPDELKRGEVGRTDTLLIFVADRATPRVGMISLPRDLWVQIANNHGEERINAAYELGGSQTAMQTVSNVIGQRIDRYAVVGLQGVRDIVDAVGGVDITVTEAIHDDTYPTDDYGYQVVDIPAGRQHMNGDTALKYARSRHQDSDFGRIARQQQVLAAVRNALMNPLNWPRIPAVAAALTQSIRTDVSPLDAVAVGAALLRDPGDPDRLVVDTTLVTPVVGDGGAFLLDAKPDLKPAVARFLGGPTAATIQVLNGAGTPGLAARTADKLAQRGLVVAGVGDASRTQAQTSIVTRPGAHATADQVAQALGVPTARVIEGTPSSGADIEVTLGSDAR